MQYKCRNSDLCVLCYGDNVWCWGVFSCRGRFCGAGCAFSVVVAWEFSLVEHGKDVYICNGSIWHHFALLGRYFGSWSIELPVTFCSLASSEVVLDVCGLLFYEFGFHAFGCYGKNVIIGFLITRQLLFMKQWTKLNFFPFGGWTQNNMWILLIVIIVGGLTSFLLGVNHRVIFVVSCFCAFICIML